MRLDRDELWAVYDTYSMPNDVQEDRGLSFDDFADRVEQCFTPDRGWQPLLDNLAAIYPISIFPVQHDAADYRNGPQVLSLIRLLRLTEEKIDRIRQLIEQQEHENEWINKFADEDEQIPSVFTGVELLAILDEDVAA